MRFRILPLKNISIKSYQVRFESGRENIEDLADFITDILKDDYLWESRTRNLKIYKEKLEKRNRLFFQQFWENKDV